MRRTPDVLGSCILSAGGADTQISALPFLLDEATQVKDKLLGIQSKTGKDAQGEYIHEEGRVHVQALPLLLQTYSGWNDQSAHGAGFSRAE